MSFDHSPNFLFFFIMLMIACLTGYYADRKGRSFANWFIIGLLIGALAPLILFFLPSLRERDNDEQPTMTVSSPPPQPTISNEMDQPKLFLPVEDKLWYYLDQNHQQYGPVSIVALKDLWNTGQLDLNSYVWSEGMEKWEKVDYLPELKEALSKYQG